MAGQRIPGAEMWDERFAWDELIYGEEPNAYLREQAMRLNPGSNVLVPGDGYGRNGLWLARQGMHVHIVDYSLSGVQRATQRAAQAGLQIEIEHADLTQWLWPLNTYDAIVSVFLHLHESVRAALHRKMLAALKPGGLIILEAFTPRQLQFKSGGPKDTSLLFTKAQLGKDFAEAELLDLQEEEIQLHEGRLHSGPAAVVHGVFRKR